MAIRNRERALRRMRAIPDAVIAKVKAQLLANAADLVVAQRAAAPADDGALRESIQYSDASDARRVRVEVRAGGPTTTRPVRKGASASYDYALAQEFGTRNMPANPFFFPVYRGRKRRYKASLRKAAKEAVAAAIRTP